jgi:hypothetical protein
VNAGVSEEADLELEAWVFGRYLIGTPPPPKLTRRYASACRTLLTDKPRPQDASVVRFVRRQPWSAPFLDAASGLLAPRGLLRTKVLIMAAILEASREFADEFLPREDPVGRVRLVALLAGIGLVAAARTLLGAALYPIATRS